MPSPQELFHANMRDADAHTALYDFLKDAVGGPVNYDDLLRSKVVYAVSAFDKLMHDLIRLGMVETFMGLRSPTPKYLAESISLSVAHQLAAASPLPPEVTFENAIRSKHKFLSFQEPAKVADGLSLIWDEAQKWSRIATKIGAPEKPTKTRLKLISDRRNSIVHESDLDPVSHEKQPIASAEVDDVFEFLRKVGNAISDLVT